MVILNNLSSSGLRVIEGRTGQTNNQARPWRMFYRFHSPSLPTRLPAISTLQLHSQRHIILLHPWNIIGFDEKRLSY